MVIDSSGEIACPIIGKGVENIVVESPYNDNEVMKLERLFIKVINLPFKYYDREQATLKSEHLGLLSNEIANLSSEYLLHPTDLIEMDGLISGYTQERLEIEATLSTLILQGNYMALPYYRQLLISLNYLIEHGLYLTDYNTENYVILGNQVKLIDFGYTYHQKEIKEAIGLKRLNEIVSEICSNRLIQMFYVVKSIILKHFYIDWLNPTTKVNIPEIVKICRYFNVDENLINEIQHLRLNIELLIRVLDQIIENFPPELKFEMSQIL